MPVKATSLAKITIPKISKTVFLRKRLFDLISDHERPITWICGPAGAGKTTLAASFIADKKSPCLWYQVDENDKQIADLFYYLGEAAKSIFQKEKPLPLLTPEYLMSVPIFTRNYFEEFFSRLKSKSNTKKFTIVFDNYQTVPPESEFHNIINIGLSLLPENIQVIFISRQAPPPVFSRLQANEKIAQILWNELKFTSDEFLGTIESKGVKDLDCNVIKQLYAKTDGWIAGLVLMLECAKTKEIDFKILDKLTHQEIFNYFIKEVFEKTDKETRDFLVNTSMLPKFTASIAEKLTQNKNSEKILSFLCKHQYFIIKQVQEESVYWYHALFSEFLLSNVKNIFSLEETSAMKKQAALLLEEADLTEYAVLLLSEIEDWEHLTMIVMTHAQTLLSQGRTETLGNWLKKIPAHLIEKNPWLLYWNGVCVMQVSPIQARAYFEKAFNIFEKANDPIGIPLSWAGIIDAIFYSYDDFFPMDTWIDRIDVFLKNSTTFPMPEAEICLTSRMVMALLTRKTWRADLPIWAERTISLAPQVSNLNLKMQAYVNCFFYTTSHGDFINARRIGEELYNLSSLLNASPLLKLSYLALDILLLIWADADIESALKKITQGLDFSEASGVPICNNQFLAVGTLAHGSRNDIETAFDFLKKMKASIPESQKHALSQYYYLTGWLHLLRGEHSQAVSMLSTSLEIEEKVGHLPASFMIIMGLSKALWAQGRKSEANDLLSNAVKTLNNNIHLSLKYPYLLTKAKFSIDENKEQECLEFLKEGFRIAREKNFFYMWWWHEPKVMSELCAIALENDIETEHVQKLIRKINLKPVMKNSCLPLETWPYELKIFTLGQFKIEKDGKPLQFTGKVQQKPLDMLKAIIALGGKEVYCATVIDALWPDTSGDAGEKAFDTNLYRLRKLLDIPDAIILTGKKVTLNPKFCWVDIWAFDHMATLSDNSLSDGIAPTEKAINLYKGHFLMNEDESTSALLFREKLCQRFISMILKAGKDSEQKKSWDKAIMYYQKGLEAYGLAEELYQQLMYSYHKTGQQAEVVKTYNRCCLALSTRLGIKPSVKTDEIYQGIVS